MSSRGSFTLVGEGIGVGPLSSVRRNWSETLNRPPVAKSSHGDGAANPQTAQLGSTAFTNNFAGLEEDLIAKGRSWGSYEYEEHDYSNIPTSTRSLTHRSPDPPWIAQPMLHAFTEVMQPEPGHVRIIMPHLLVGSKLGLVVKHLVVVAITNVKASQLGFQPGDRILAVNDNPVGGTTEFFDEVSRAMAENQYSNKPVVFDIWRNLTAPSATARTKPSLIEVQGNPHVSALHMSSELIPVATVALNAATSGEFGHAQPGNGALPSKGCHLSPVPNTASVTRHGGRHLSRRKHVCPFRGWCEDEQQHAGDSTVASTQQNTIMPANLSHQNLALGSRRRHLCGSSTSTKEGLPSSRRAVSGC